MAVLSEEEREQLTEETKVYLAIAREARKREHSENNASLVGDDEHCVTLLACHLMLINS